MVFACPGISAIGHSGVTKKHNCLSPFQRHDKTTSDQELLTSPMLPPLKALEEDLCCELLSYAAKHTEHRPNCVQLTRGRTTSPTALQRHRSHTRATQETYSYRTDCHDSHILTANHFFLAMSPASRSQQMHSEPQLGIKNIQQ